MTILAQPTRAKLLALLRESGGPVATAELAELVGLHPNGVRNHLELLAEAGLVERGRSASRRGRPRDEWTAAEPGPFEDPTGNLVRWLARAYPSGRSDLKRIESVGRQAGLEIPVEAMSDSRRAFVLTLNSLGFEAEDEERDGGFCCRLGRCPYREAVHENQEAVCALHRGLTSGLLESTDPGFRLEEFQPRDPDQAGCLIGVGVETETL
ncbi:MAG: helix-turn-helix domain-containing protein [Solirubrobacterales bacterium]|nr:helix-turn-helix domain-containing protein [Solirubrobacterales bacterium]